MGAAKPLGNVRLGLGFALAGSMLALGPAPAEAVARYRARLTAEIEIVPRATGVGFGFDERALTDAPPEPGDGVIFSSGGETWALSIAQTIFAEATAEGTAFYIGSGDPADATGVTYAAASFGIVSERETPVSFNVQVRIRDCAIEGSVEEDLAELASTVLAVQLFGNAALGIPEDPVIEWRTNTRDDGVGTHFDMVCVPFSRNYTLTVPGYTDPFAFDVLTLGLRVTAGGQAISAYGNSIRIPLEDAPPVELAPFEPLDPVARFAALLRFFDEAREAKRLFGTGPKGQAWRRLLAMRHLLERSASQAEKERASAACEKLMLAFRRSDGRAVPMDYVAGPAVRELVSRIRDLGQSLRCPLSSEKRADN